MPSSPVKYAFIERHGHEHSVRRMRKIMTVHPSGYYAGKADPVSPRGWRAAACTASCVITTSSSMSRRGNCHDNAVAESFFQLLTHSLLIYPDS